MYFRYGDRIQFRTIQIRKISQQILLHPIILSSIQQLYIHFYTMERKERKKIKIPGFFSGIYFVLHIQNFHSHPLKKMIIYTPPPIESLYILYFLLKFFQSDEFKYGNPFSHQNFLYTFSFLRISSLSN